ncbi:MAG: hypothetical protein J6333_08725, partial [Planctomycetes bacterium]|nr:hypothetical protein [Planctomycetota bacterium]
MIRHLRINGFGALRGARAFRPGLNAVVDAAPSGKSSLAALLFYLFYPDSPAARAAWPDLRPLAAYAPWDGGDFGATAALALP